MSIQLDPEVERRIHRQVETGHFDSASDVVRAAIALLEQHEELDELKADIKAGMDAYHRGESEEFTDDLLDKIFADAIHPYLPH